MAIRLVPSDSSNRIGRMVECKGRRREVRDARWQYSRGRSSMPACTSGKPYDILSWIVKLERAVNGGGGGVGWRGLFCGSG
jgi:hypothetical protein